MTLSAARRPLVFLPEWGPSTCWPNFPHLTRRTRGLCRTQINLCCLSRTKNYQTIYLETNGRNAEVDTPISFFPPFAPFWLLFLNRATSSDRPLSPLGDRSPLPEKLRETEGNKNSTWETRCCCYNSTPPCSCPSSHFPNEKSTRVPPLYLLVVSLYPPLCRLPFVLVTSWSNESISFQQQPPPRSCTCRITTCRPSR